MRTLFSSSCPGRVGASVWTTYLLLATGCGDTDPAPPDDIVADTQADAAASDTVPADSLASDVPSQDSNAGPDWPEGPYGFAVGATLPEGIVFVDPVADGTVSFDDAHRDAGTRVGVWFIAEGWCFEQCRSASEAVVDAALADASLAVFYSLGRDRFGEPLWVDAEAREGDRNLAASWHTNLGQRADTSTVVPPFPVLIDAGAAHADALALDVEAAAAIPAVVIFRTDTMRVVFAGAYPGDEAFASALASASED
jgi:hypothetical protein